MRNRQGRSESVVRLKLNTPYECDAWTQHRVSFTITRNTCAWCTVCKTCVPYSIAEGDQKVTHWKLESDGLTCMFRKKHPSPRICSLISYLSKGSSRSTTRSLSLNVIYRVPAKRQFRLACCASCHLPAATSGHVQIQSVSVFTCSLAPPWRERP